MPFTFNPFSGNFDNTPSTDKGDNSYTNLLANSGNWNSNYSLVQSKSANWEVDIDTGVRGLTGNFAVNSELVKYLPLSGGIITGNTQINSNLTVYGNISATGNSYFSNTVYSTTSALSVVNIGNTGPALYVANNGTGDIASFYDLDQNIEVLHVGGNNGTFPNVGVKTSTPNVDFTVNGQISSNDIIYSNYGNSNNWNSNYTLTQSKSASWDLAVTSGYQGTDIKALTGFWDASRTYVNSNSGSLNGVYALTGNYASVYSTVNTNSANWNNAFSNQNKYLPLSGGVVNGKVVVLSGLEIGTGIETLIVNDNFITVNGQISSNDIIYSNYGNSNNWNSNYTLTQSKSASWDLAATSGYQGTDIKALTGFWDSSRTYVNSNSGSLNGVYALTGNYASVYSTVNTNSANWGIDIDTGVRSLTGNYASVYSTVNTNSANWGYQGTDIKALTGNYASVYSTVNTNSANWGYQGTDIKALTGNYASVYSTVNTNSANWGIDIDTGVRSLTGNYASVYSTVNTNSANWGYQGTDIKALTGNYASVYSTVNTNSANWGIDIDTGVRSLTGNYASVYSTVNTNSANWGTGSYQGTDIKALTGNYASVYSTVNTNSANWTSSFTTIQSNSSVWILEDFIVACSDESTNLTTTISAVTFRVPFGMYLNSVRASVNVAPVGSTIIVDIKQSGTSIFSTLLSIDANEETSTTAATPAVISNRNLTDNSKVVVSINQVGSTTAGTGLKLTFKGYRV